MQSVTLKITWNNDIRRVQATGETPSYVELHKMIYRFFFRDGLSKGFTIKYLDDEKDLVTIASEREWAEALQFASKQQPALLRISICEQTNKRPSAQAPPAAASTSTPSSLHEDLLRHVQTLTEGLPNNEELRRSLEGMANNVRPLFQNVGHSLQHVVESNRWDSVLLFLSLPFAPVLISLSPQTLSDPNWRECSTCWVKGCLKLSNMTPMRSGPR